MFEGDKKGALEWGGIDKLCTKGCIRLRQH